MDNSVKRGDIFYADLSPVVGSEQGGVRPVLIVQNDTGNRHSPTVIAAAITSQTGKARLPTHISVAPLSCGLPKESVILLEQVRTLDKRRLREKMGRLDDGVMRQVDAAIAAMEADGTLASLKERWGLSLVTEAVVEAEQAAGSTGLGAGDAADDAPAAGGGA